LNQPKKQPVGIGREFRPWAIWIWNLRISKEEVIKQIKFFIEKGFGGIAIKIGRDMCPPFLSEEFFELFTVALQIAQKNNIGIRMAEDFSLPWNGAFNSIAQRSKQSRAQCLSLEHSEVLQNKALFEKAIPDPKNTIIQVGKVENEKLILSKVKNLTVQPDKNVVSWKAPPGLWQIMIFRKGFVIDPAGFYVPNPFREQSARQYIDSVWELLKKRFAKFMPSTFEGFISELPASLPSDNSIPWDDDLVVKYRSKYKKNLIALLPCLFFTTETQDAKNRPHIYSFFMQSLHERFTLTLENWCKKYRLSHWVLCAERPIQKAQVLLRDCCVVPSQNFSSVGIQNQEGSEENYAVVRAMADMNAKEFRRETITVIGRNRLQNASSLQVLKSEIDQSITGGPSRIILDGCFFNIDNRSHIKTPFNPSWYAPGANHMDSLCSYAGRVKKLIANLQLSRQVAVLFPSDSIMADFSVSSDEAVRKGMLSLHKVMDELYQCNLDFDIISEDQLLSCSLFSNGEFNTASKVRKGNYQALVLPYCRLVSKNLFVFLERLTSKKGIILFIDEAPQGTLEDGILPSFTSRVTKILHSKAGKVHVSAAKDIEGALSHIKSAVSVTVQGRKCADIIAVCGGSVGQQVFCLQNKSESQDYFATVEIPEEKYYYLSDCTSGEVHEILDVQRKDDACKINLNFSPHQTHFIVASNQKLAATVLPKGKRHPINVTGTMQRNYRIVLKGQWYFSPCSLNVLPLSTWNTRIGLSREFGGYSHFYETYFEVKEPPAMCILSLGGLRDACLGLVKGDKSIEVNVNGNRLTEQAAVDPKTIVLPVCEQPDPQAGSPAASVPHAITPCLELLSKNSLCFNLKDSVHKGINRISLRTLGLVFDPLTISYPPLIAGTFAIVKGSAGWVIDNTAPMAGHDSWTKYGYPYLSGCGTYKQVFEIPSDYNRLVLKFPQVSGTAHVMLNGKSLSVFNWQPMEIDVTEICESKRNELAVCITNTIDNVVRMNGRPSGLTGEVFLDVY
jgi:hypothetical protein